MSDIAFVTVVFELVERTNKCMGCCFDQDEKSCRPPGAELDCSAGIYKQIHIHTYDRDINTLKARS